MKMLTTVGLAAVILASSGNVFADKKIQKRLQSANISLTEAIAIAEGATQGKAYEAELEKNSFEPEYEVEVYANGKTFEVSVNAVTSEVIRIREDKKKD